MTSRLSVTFSWQAVSLFTPDRLRSFLKYLREREPPLRFAREQDDLYSASDMLLDSRHQELALTADAGYHLAPVSLNVSTGTPPYRVSLEFNADQIVLDLLESQPGLSILVAGARMLSAERASITSFTDASAQSGAPGRAVAGVHLIAAWNAPHIPPPRQSLVLVEEQWDGARVWLHTPLSQAFLLQAALACLAPPDAAGSEPVPAGAGHLPYILQQALCSPDWRTRIVAMIAAVRRNLTSLALAVRQMEIPTTSVSGVTNDLRHMLIAMRKAALLLLGGVPVPLLEATAPGTRSGMQAHLLRLVAGKPIAFEDSFAVLVQSLVPPTGTRT
jgi:hypothetical protein